MGQVSVSLPRRPQSWSCEEGREEGIELVVAPRSRGDGQGARSASRYLVAHTDEVVGGIALGRGSPRHLGRRCRARINPRPDTQGVAVGRGLGRAGSAPEAGEVGGTRGVG